MTRISREEIDAWVLGSASDARLKGEKLQQGRGETVGQVRRDNRRTKEQSEKLIREFLVGQDETVVFLDICDYLNRRPSPILRQIVEEMAARGEVEITQDFGAGPLIARNLYRMVR